MAGTVIIKGKLYEETGTGRLVMRPGAIYHETGVAPAAGAGYTHKPLGLATTAYAKVNDVAKADIAEINGA